MKNLSIKFAVTLFALFSTFGVVFAGSFTEDHQAALDQLTESLKSAPVLECQDRLFTIFDLELAKFFDQINESLNNKSSTSSLTNILIARFSIYKEALRSHFDNIYFSYSGGNITQEVTAAYLQCSGMTDEYITLGKNHMIDQLKVNSGQKKSAIMLEKFQALNEKMGDMNDQVTEFYSFYETFNNKLFGFVKKCVKN